MCVFNAVSPLRVFRGPRIFLHISKERIAILLAQRNQGSALQKVSLSRDGMGLSDINYGNL